MKKIFSLILFLSLLFPLASYCQDRLFPLLLNHSDSSTIILNDSLYKVYLSSGDYREASRHLDQVALLYWKHNYFDQAIEYFKRSISINEKIQNYDGIAKINTNLALIYFDKGAYDSAYTYFDKTLSVRRALNQKVGVISALVNEAVVLNKLKKHSQAIEKLSEALTLAREINDVKEMRSCYGMLAETYQKSGNLDSALYYYNFFKSFNDYLTKQEVSKTKAELEKEAALRKIAELEAQNKQLLLRQKERELGHQRKMISKLTTLQQHLFDSLSKKELVIKVFEQQAHIASLQNKALKREQKKKNIIILLGMFVIVLLLVLVGVLIYFYRKQKKLFITISDKNDIISQQKEELGTFVQILQDKNKQITDSINYAQGIQKAIFSRNLSLIDYLADYFELYLPRDIVSGDFIFSSRLGNKIFVAVGDCTGHGVPGAFLTIIGYNLLHHFINSKHLDDLEQIILELNKSFYDILNQANTSNLDALDIGICSVDTDTKALEFVGKNNNLIITTAQGQVDIIRGDKYVYDVFTNDTEKKFHKKIIKNTQGTWFYLYTDGVVHQMNQKFKKFSLKRLTKTLSEIHDLDGEAKKQKIFATMVQWSLNSIQIDDMTIIGFKIH